MVVIIVNHFRKKRKCFFVRFPIFSPARRVRPTGSRHRRTHSSTQQRQKSHTGRSGALKSEKNSTRPPKIPASMYRRSSPSPKVMVK